MLSRPNDHGVMFLEHGKVRMTDTVCKGSKVDTAADRVRNARKRPRMGGRLVGIRWGEKYKGLANIG